MSWLRLVAVLAAAVAVYWGLWRVGRRLPARLARRGQAGPVSPTALSAWRFRVQLALLPVKLALWVGAAWLASAQVPRLAAGRDALLAFLAASFRRPLFTVEEKSFSAADVLLLPLVLAALWVAVSLLVWFLRERLLAATGLEAGVREGASSILRYALLFLGAIVVLQVWGVDASTLAIFGSVVGIGLGFGLQTIANNFVSGILLGLERPIKPGDYVEVAGFAGTVERIGARSTVIRTQDRVSILVPNSRLLETEVVNWSHGDPVSRLHVPVGVAYGSPIARVRGALLEVARRHPEVLADPPPEVQLDGFGDHALLFDLEVWTRDPRHQNNLKSDLCFGIEAALRRAGIEIPFPQRDLHLRTTRFDRLVERWGRASLPAEEEKPMPTAAAAEATMEEEELFGERRLSPEELRQLAARMRGPGGVEIQDRRHLFNLYPRCFLGREAVDWLTREMALPREQAIHVGLQLEAAGLLRHVLDEHAFEDANLFYRFTADEAETGA